MKKRLCVFCGCSPENKNKEHVLPQWLLKMTGDPKRVVKFGFNYPSGKEIKFDWSSFVVPSCEKCNSEYGKLEVRAKGYVERLLKREALTSIEYIDFLDWLDKVRISVWLAYRTLEGNPANIIPHFHVNSRLGKKDRMLAIYSIPGLEDGLNTYGMNTLCFHSSPSVFGLRINDIFILNMSYDYLFSGRCGFPSPMIMENHIDGEYKDQLVLKDFKITRKIKHPLIRKAIIKPSIHLYQPIMMEDNSGKYQSGFFGDYSIYDTFIDSHTTKDKGKGILYFQHLDRVSPIYDQNTLIEFEEVDGIHSKTIGDIISQIYDFQNFIYKKSVFKANDKEFENYMKKRKKQYIKFNKLAIGELKRVTNRFN